MLVDQTKNMGIGLASAFLMAMGNDASQPSMAGFNVPPLKSEEFKSRPGVHLARRAYRAVLHPDPDLNLFSTAAMDQVNTIIDTAKGAQPNTSLCVDINVGLPGQLRGHPRLLRARYEAHRRCDRRRVVILILMANCCVR